MQLRLEVAVEGMLCVNATRCHAGSDLRNACWMLKLMGSVIPRAMTENCTACRAERKNPGGTRNP
jgi:hypothetical protein